MTRAFCHDWEFAIIGGWAVWSGQDKPLHPERPKGSERKEHVQQPPSQEMGQGGAWRGTTMPSFLPPPQPLVSSRCKDTFAAAGIFAPVRTLVRAMTRDILRPYSECSPPYPLSFLVFSTGPEVREDSCITDHRCANHPSSLRN